MVIKDLDEGNKWRFTGFYHSPFQHDRDKAWIFLKLLYTDGDLP